MPYYNTSPNFIAKDYEEIFSEMLIRAGNTGLISDDPSILDYVDNLDDTENTIIIDLSNISLMLSYVYDDLNRFSMALDLDKATGYFLDYILKPFLERNPPEYAVGEATFECTAPPQSDIEIPVGTVISSSGDEPILFETTDTRYLTAGSNDVTIPIQCLEIGEVGNVPDEYLDNLVNEIDGIGDVYNELKTTGGRDTEPDNKYRERGRIWTYAQAKGNYDAFVDALDSVSAIEGYRIERWWRGYGTTRIIIDPPTEPVLNMAQIAVEDVMALNEDITVTGVESVPINITLEINTIIDEPIMPSSDRITQNEAEVRKYLTTYISGGENIDGEIITGMSIGEDFIPLQANAYLLSQIPDLKNITNIEPSEPISILNHQKATIGTINITSVTVG